jgi:putative ABC transport system ATP-binding protein
LPKPPEFNIIERPDCLVMGGDTAKIQTPILRAENIFRSVDNGNGVKNIISDFSFDFNKGGIYSILGPSGAGKSSLLRLFNRLDEITDGRIFFNKKDIRELSPCRLRREIGYLFQTPYMFPETVKENFLYVDTSLSDDSIISMLSEVNLGPDYLQTNVEVLSIGERQRIALARLLVLQPKILLLDEPTSALDEKNAALVIELVNKMISQNGMTAIVVTHNPVQATAFDSEALLIINGRLVEHAPVKKLIENPETEAGKTFLTPRGK